jgi:hypothetical protein
VHAHGRASNVIAAGLELAPDDPTLIELRGDAKAAGGDVEVHYWLVSRARSRSSQHRRGLQQRLLKREGRLEEAIEAWSYILDYHEPRGLALQAEWPQARA